MVNDSVVVGRPMISALLRGAAGGEERSRRSEASIGSVAFALAGTGAGNWSIDHALSLNDHGVLWAIGALVLGAVGGVGAVVQGRAADRHSRGATTSTPTTA